MVGLKKDTCREKIIFSRFCFYLMAFVEEENNPIIDTGIRHTSPVQITTPQFVVDLRNCTKMVIPTLSQT
jgi:hypothetical protein